MDCEIRKLSDTISFTLNDQPILIYGILPLIIFTTLLSYNLLQNKLNNFIFEKFIYFSINRPSHLVSSTEPYVTASYLN